MKVSNDVINVLSNSTIDGVNLYLPGQQLDRKLYVSVDKALKALGGQWSKKEKAHVFNVDPADLIEQLLQTGEYIDAKKEFQFFETPDELAKYMAIMADIDINDTVLEPSAGRAGIAKHLRDYCRDADQLSVVELNPDNRKFLIEDGYNLIGDNFLDIKYEFDIIVANPPFSKQQDIDHVNHMLDLAMKKVVSVMSASILFRTNKKTRLFRERLHDLGAEIITLPDESFKGSGTNVKTCLVFVEF